MENISQFFLVYLFHKSDILFESAGHNPGFLRRVCDCSCNIYASFLRSNHLVDDGQQQTGLSTANITNYHSKGIFLDFEVDVFKSMYKKGSSFIIFLVEFLIFIFIVFVAVLNLYLTFLGLSVMFSVNLVLNNLLLVWWLWILLFIFLLFFILLSFPV